MCRKNIFLKVSLTIFRKFFRNYENFGLRAVSPLRASYIAVPVNPPLALFGCGKPCLNKLEI